MQTALELRTEIKNKIVNAYSEISEKMAEFCRYNEWDYQLDFDPKNLPEKEEITPFYHTYYDGYNCEDNTFISEGIRYHFMSLSSDDLLYLYGYLETVYESLAKEDGQ
jgi:hypothetical protein